MVRKIDSYDKLGGQIFVRALKYHAFGDENVRLTRKRCERFFEEDAHFSRQSSYFDRPPRALLLADRAWLASRKQPTNLIQRLP